MECDEESGSKSVARLFGNSYHDSLVPKIRVSIEITEFTKRLVIKSLPPRRSKT